MKINYYTQTTSDCIKILIGVTFNDDLDLDVKIESENWNFLKYGRIGKHPMQSLYTRMYTRHMMCSCQYIHIFAHMLQGYTIKQYTHTCAGGINREPRANAIEVVIRNKRTSATVHTHSIIIEQATIIRVEFITPHQSTTAC